MIRGIRTFAVVVLVAASAFAEDGKGAPPSKIAEWNAGEGFFAPPPAPTYPAEARLFQPAAAAMPGMDVQLAEGMPTATPKAQKFWDDPTGKELIDPPKAKHAFALVAKGGKPGTVFVYEYPEKVPANLASYLSLLFWLDEDSPSERRPEEVILSGRFAFVLSFPYGDPAAEWFKQTLRQRFQIAAAPIRADAAAVRAEITAAAEAGDADGALAIFAKKSAIASTDAESLRIAGTMCRGKGDWAGAQMHYRAAWELVRTLKDPQPAASVFNIATWLGYSALNLGKIDDALQAFRTARVFGTVHNVGGSAVWGPYNICCALCKAKRLDDAVQFLAEAISKNAEIKAHAREDGDLEELRKRADVRKLLE